MVFLAPVFVTFYMFLFWSFIVVFRWGCFTLTFYLFFSLNEMTCSSPLSFKKKNVIICFV